MKNAKTRIYVKMFAVSIAALAVVLFMLATAPDTAVDKLPPINAEPQHVTLTWSDDPMTTQTITWKTGTDVKDGWVEYKESGAAKAKTAKVKAKWSEWVAAEGGSPDTVKMHIFSVTLRNLEPGTKYEYRVGGGEYWTSSTFSTEAANTGSFKFLVFGDSQNNDRDYSTWQDTLSKAYAANRDARFMINMGDLVDAGQDYRHWIKWFAASKGIIDRISVMPLHGNHETYDANDNSSKPLQYISQFKLFQNGPDGLKGEVYSYDYGNAHFAVLDSQMFEEYPDDPEARSKMLHDQIEWLEKDLAGTKQQWKIVLFHKAPYYIAKTRTSMYLRQFQPVFDKYHVDIVFNGHDHGVERTFPIYNGQFMSKPSEGTVYYIAGRTNQNVKKNLRAKVWSAFFHNPEDQPVYQTVMIEKDMLTINCFTQDGSLVDTYTIHKGHPEKSTATILPRKEGEPGLALYGTPMESAAAPKQVDGTWFIDFTALLKYTDSTFDKETNTLTYSNTLLHVTDTMFLDPAKKTGKKAMISADALAELGFSVQWNTKINYIMVER